MTRQAESSAVSPASTLVNKLELIMFDIKKFQKAKFTHRTTEVPVSDLADFFPADEKPIWTVRGLEGVEVAKANETINTNKNLVAAAEAIESALMSDKIRGMKQIIAQIQDVPNEIAKRLVHLTLGSVEPECDYDAAIKLCKVAPVEFYNITNEIWRLTGLGMVPGKQKGSTQTPESESV